MSGMEPKKLALLRILQILHQDSDEAHPMTQKQIGDRLERDYGIALERKAIGRNLALLKEAGIDVIDKSEDGPGCYLGERILEDSEIRLLIDSVLASKHISASNSRELIDKLCMLCSRHFKKHIKYIYAVDSWGKTKINNVLFYNIAQLDEAIAAGRQVCYQYNKFGPDKELHRSSDQVVSPYQMILHNQRYYLVAYSARWSSIVYHRMDHITEMKITEEPAYPLERIPGFANGIDYSRFSSALPYMFTDRPERVTFLARASYVDQVVDWFGNACRITQRDGDTVEVSAEVSPNAMLYWALQYAPAVEVISPPRLREKIRAALLEAVQKYN